jgi:phage antirepressor YoqD-like protein
MNIVEIGNKQVTMSSREIAELTGKQHKDVLYDVRNMLSALEKDTADFSAVYKASNGQEYEHFVLDKEHTLILVSGYNIKLRAAIIKRWQELEAEVKPKVPQTYLEALKELVQITEEKERLVAKVEQDAPLVTFAETVTNSTDCIAVGDLAKVVSDQNIKLGRNKLFQWLRDNDYLMEDNKPYQKYIEQGLFSLIEQTFKTPYGDKVGFKTLVTGKGQITIVEKLRAIFGENK